MKVRVGFVSNSSSSSFVLFVTKADHDKAMAELHPFVQAVIKQMIKEGYAAEGKLGGVDLVYFGVNEGNTSWTEYFNMPKWDKNDIPMNKYGYKMDSNSAFDVYKDKLKELKVEVIDFDVEY
jgi:hypothetical protein